MTGRLNTRTVSLPAHQLARGVSSQPARPATILMSEVKNHAKAPTKTRLPRPQPTDTRDPLSVEMGRRLRLARDFVGLSLHKLSDGIDELIKARKPGKLRLLIPLGASRVSNWEQGLKQIGVREAWSVAQLLQTDPAWLLCLTDHAMTPQEKDLLRHFRALPERLRNQIAVRIATEAMPWMGDGAIETSDFVSKPEDTPPRPVRSKK
jgi:transcriptional regulator with XRE-family HTH domain